MRSVRRDDGTLRGEITHSTDTVLVSVGLKVIRVREQTLIATPH